MNARVLAAAALVLLFVASRLLLLVTSYDANVNWEEPVFLFSALELARDGATHVFDHQDDLNHGGSVPLLLLAVPWVRLTGTSLLTLKGLAVAWSTATLIAFLVVGWRHLSPRAALLFGLCFVAASPSLARLNVTLVGSHPESLLPAALALGSYLSWVRTRAAPAGRSGWRTFLLGVWSGLAVWMSYAAVMFVAPLVTLRIVCGRDRGRGLLVGSGVVAGFAPWIWQNLWLRPHGAGEWRRHVAAVTLRNVGDTVWRVVADTAASFGWMPVVGDSLLALSGMALMILTVVLVSRFIRKETSAALRLLPFVAAVLLGVAMLVVANVPEPEPEGYYHARFYVGLQVALFWVVALAVDELVPRMRLGGVIAVALFVVAAIGHATSFGQGTSYVPDLEKDRARGCTVFGLAETDRAPTWSSAMARLERLPDGRCRERAFAGFGWGVGNRFLAGGPLADATARLQAIPDAGLRWAACGGFNFALRRVPAPRTSEAQAAWSALGPTCVRPAASAATVPAATTATPKRNLVLINVDTLRADHLGCHGYGRATSPFLDSLAADGVRFTEARVNSSFTRESVAALLTGRLPSRSGAMGWEAKPRAGDPTLGPIFERAGYATGFFSATTMLTDPAFTAGFQVVRHLTEQWGRSGLGPQLSAEALAFAEAAAGKPFVLYLHYLDPHGPYDPSAVHDRRFAPHPPPSRLGLYADVRPRLPELVRQGFGPGEPRFEDLVARYDAEIADTDAAIATLVTGLRRLGVLDRTIVVVTSDHGEEFLEHGFVEHAWTLYEEVLRVPLIFWPAAALPKLDGRKRAAAIDVLPTLLQIMDVAERPAELEGRSLLGAAAEPFIAELVIEERNVVRTVIADRWKYVAAQRWLPPAERPAAARIENELRTQGAGGHLDRCGAGVSEELYDLAVDPGERRNVLAEHPETVTSLRAALGPVLAECRRAPAAAELPPGERERLRTLGYVE